jgi:AraC-like DNA-binding protein
MFFDFNLKSSILFIFFVHGLVFFGLHLYKGIKEKHVPSLWLSLFTLLCVLYISPFMLGYAGWYSMNPYRDLLFYIPFPQLFLLPPVLYFYCKSLFGQSSQFQRKDLWHFLPAILYLIYSLVVFITDKVILNEYFFYEDGRDKDFWFPYQAAGFVSLISYLALSLKSYHRYKINTYNTYSFADAIILKWAQRFLIAILLLMILRLLFFILNPEWAEFGRKFWYYVLFSILFYYITIRGYYSSIRAKEPVNLLTADDEFETQSNAKAGENTSMDDLDAWKSKLEELMVNDRIFTNPELSIFHMAQRLDTHPKKVSQVINQAFGVNFNDYINEYRSKYFLEKIEQGAHEHKTLLGLALECGFNSKSTFNRAFRKLMHMSPKEYLQNTLKK